MASPHIDTEKEWSRIHMELTEINLELKAELERMVDKNLPVKVIQPHQQRLNKLIETIIEADVLVSRLNHICSLQHARGRLQQAVLHQASKAQTPEQAYQIIKTFTKP